MASKDGKDEEFARIAVVGINNTGKSQFILDWLKSILDLSTDLVIFYVSSDPKSLSGVRRLNTVEELMRVKHGVFKYFNYDSDQKGLEELIQACQAGVVKRGAIVFDDCAPYILSNPSNTVKRFLGDHRPFELNLIFTVHSYKDLSIFVRRKLTGYVVCKTQDIVPSPEVFTDWCYPNATMLHAAYKEVMLSSNHYEKRVVPVGKAIDPDTFLKLMKN